MLKRKFLKVFLILTSSLLCDGCSGLVKDLFMWKDVDGTAKTVALRGYLRCRQQPYTEGKLKLYDHDTYSMDEKMSETVYPDKDGHFYIKGTGYEEKLNPRLYIYHNCGSLSKWCYYKTYFAIPQSRLVHGEFVTEKDVFYLNYIELSNEQSHIDCIN